MPWSGTAPNKTFTRTDGTRTGDTTWAQANAAGVKIVTAGHDAHDSDLKTGIDTALCKDGGNAATANIPMGGFTHTNIANATARTSPASFAQAQDNAAQYVSTVGGTADVITLTPTVAITAYAAGQRFQFIAGATNTGAVTVNVSAVGAKAITRSVAAFTALSAGDIIVGTVVDIEYDGTRFQLLTLANSATTSQVVGADCSNNAGTPTTQFDLDADSIVVRTSAGDTVVRWAPGAAITNNVSTAGPAANGRDQAGAFSAASWVHFYWIWNGTTLATLSSAVAPPTGPTLPTGYTYWAYAGAVYFTAGSALSSTRIKGSWVYYDEALEVLGAGAATVQTAVSLTAAVPPNAQAVQFSFICGIEADGSGIALVDFRARVATGKNAFVARTDTSGLGAFGRCYNGAGTFTVPNVSQNIYYMHAVTNGTDPAATLGVMAYQIPNGGE